MNRTSMAAIVAVLAVAVAGCGSSKKNDFKKDWNTQSTSLRTLGTNLATEISTASKQSDAVVIAKVSALATRAHAAVDSLRKLSPPSSEKADVSTLADDLDKAAGDLDSIVTSAKAKDLKTVESSSKSLVLDSEPISKLHAKIDAAVGK